MEGKEGRGYCFWHCYSRRPKVISIAEILRFILTRSNPKTCSLWLKGRQDEHQHPSSALTSMSSPTAAALVLPTAVLFLSVLTSLALSPALTIVRHAQRQTLLKAAVLTLVPILLLDLATPVTFLILELHADGPAEEALVGQNRERERGVRGLAFSIRSSRACRRLCASSSL